MSKVCTGKRHLASIFVCLPPIKCVDMYMPCTARALKFSPHFHRRFVPLIQRPAPGDHSSPREHVQLPGLAKHAPDRNAKLAHSRRDKPHRPAVEAPVKGLLAPDELRRNRTRLAAHGWGGVQAEKQSDGGADRGRLPSRNPAVRDSGFGVEHK
jgi:hypothetical protein